MAWNEAASMTEEAILKITKGLRNVPFSVGQRVRYSERYRESLSMASALNRWESRNYVVVEFTENSFFENGVCVWIADAFALTPTRLLDLELIDPNWRIPYWQLFRSLRKNRGWRYGLQKVFQIWWSWDAPR